jgi:nucleoside-diphosphate-sugar epimerase
MQMSLQSSHLVVTGGNGFIGTHLLRALVSLGNSCDVLVPQGGDTSRLEDIPSIRVTCFADPEALGPAVAKLNPDIVFHLGALVCRQRTLMAFRETLRWNLLSTLYLFEALVKTNVRRVVQIGSGEEYGCSQPPFHEDTVPDPVSPYAASKAASACYARMFYNCFGLPVVVIRPSVVYGPGQAAQFLIPEVITALLGGHSVDTTEGIQTRDFLYIADLVNALLQAATVPGVEGEVFNIGSGEAVSVRTCIERIELLTGKQGLVRYGVRPYGKNEISLYSVDIRHAEEHLNWKPCTTLSEGLGLTIAAFANALGL